MTEYPRLKTYPYIGGVIVALAAAGVWTVGQFPIAVDLSRFWLLPTLALLTALAGRFPFRVSPQGDATVSTAPIFLAVLLLHPVEAALVAVIGTLIAEALLKAHPEAIAFNSGAQGLVAILSGLVFWGLRPEAGITFTSGVMISAVASGIVLHLVNHSLLFGMITIVKGRGFWGRWWEAWRFESILDASLLIAGILGAQLIDLAWWWLIVLIVPFVVTYYGFRRSVEETVTKTELADKLEGNLNQLRETQSQLIQSAKLAGIGTLSAGLAHEINNPLTIITGRAELLIAKLRKSPESVTSDQVLTEVKNIYDMGVRISTIMKQLLSYSRKSETLTDVRLDSVLDDSVQLLQGKIEKRGIELVREYHQIAQVRGVANQLQQVFVNILSNSIDASPDLSTIVVGCDAFDGTAVAYVKDSGSGIPREAQDRIFEPFFTTKEVGEGTGLGLYICHKIVEDHDGEITIDSEQGKGTTFSVRLPLSKALEEQDVTAA